MVLLPDRLDGAGRRWRRILASLLMAIATIPALAADGPALHSAAPTNGAQAAAEHPAASADGLAGELRRWGWRALALGVGAGLGWGLLRLGGSGGSGSRRRRDDDGR